MIDCCISSIAISMCFRPCKVWRMPGIAGTWMQWCHFVFWLQWLRHILRLVSESTVCEWRWTEDDANCSKVTMQMILEALKHLMRHNCQLHTSRVPMRVNWLSTSYVISGIEFSVRYSNSEKVHWNSHMTAAVRCLLTDVLDNNKVKTHCCGAQQNRH